MSEFDPLVASPLLIAHVRNPGGRGGRRITAGRLDGEWGIQYNYAYTTTGTPLANVNA